MKRVAISVISAAVLLVAVVAASAASARSGESGVAGKCPRVTRHLVTADPQAEIFEASSYVFGCVFGRPRSYELGYVSEPTCESTACDGVRRVVLAGTVVAYESFLTADVDRWYVVIRDLRSGRVLRHLPTGALLKPSPGNAGVGPVVALVVKPNGSVAWIARDYERSMRPTAESEELPHYDVYASEESGTRLLASGLDVRPSSLALAGSTLYWTQGGKPASAVLN
jgi:hypothetical protein